MRQTATNIMTARATKQMPRLTPKTPGTVRYRIRANCTQHTAINPNRALSPNCQREGPGRTTVATTGSLGAGDWGGAATREVSAINPNDEIRIPNDECRRSTQLVLLNSSFVIRASSFA